MISDSKKPWLTFTGGEITEELFGRVDLPEMSAALATCQNFTIAPHGPAVSRAGSQYVNATKSNGVARLIPFIRGNGESLVIEMGAGYFRFHKNAGTILSAPSTPYEVSNPYLVGELFDIVYEQTEDVVKFTHKNWRTRTLTRTADDNWALAVVTFGSSIAAPTAPTVTPTGTGAFTYRYVVTAVNSLGEESVASTAGSTTNDISIAGQQNLVVNWGAVTGASYYNVYKEWAESRRYFLIGSTTDRTVGVMDDNIAPDFSKSPPEAVNPFGTSDGTTTTPSVVGHFDQREIYAAPTGDPQRFWASLVGAPANLNTSPVPQDNEPFNYKLSGVRAHTIRHAVAFTDLILLTNSAVWRIAAPEEGALTPATVHGKPKIAIGATTARPVKFQDSLLFANARGEHLIGVQFSPEGGSFEVSDLSQVAAHLVDGYSWVQMDFQETPYPTWWGVRSDGLLVGMTYSPKQNIIAWHKHQLGGTNVVVKSIAIVPETTTFDAIYLVVERTINGGTKRYIERINNRAFSNLAHSFCVDSGLIYDSTPATTFTGLGHLEGQTVAVLADGVPTTATVSSGQITLGTAASVVIVGLGYNCDLKTPPLSYNADAYGMGQREVVSGVRLRVKNTSGGYIGPDASHLEALQLDLGESAGLRSGIIKLEGGPFDWTEDSQIMIRQSSPLPMLISALAIDFASAD